MGWRRRGVASPETKPGPPRKPDREWSSPAKAREKHAFAFAKRGSFYGWLAHLWTLDLLALPLPLLFHPYFLNGVVCPLIGMAQSAASTVG